MRKGFESNWSLLSSTLTLLFSTKDSTALSQKDTSWILSLRNWQLPLKDILQMVQTKLRPTSGILIVELGGIQLHTCILLLPVLCYRSIMSCIYRRTIGILNILFRVEAYQHLLRLQSTKLKVKVVLPPLQYQHSFLTYQHYYYYCHYSYYYHQLYYHHFTL